MEQKQKRETKAVLCNVHPRCTFLLVLTKPDSLPPRDCYQVAACQRHEKYHVGATKECVKVRALTKKADAVKKLKVTSKRVCVAETPAALNAVTAY